MNTKRKNLFKILIYVAASVMPCGVYAQELSKEITVEHDVVTEHREAFKLSVVPVVALDTEECPTLPLAFRSVPVTLSPTASRLPAASYADSLFAATPRGYAALGYFPMWNAAASAGYRIVDTRKTLLKAWMQFDGSAYVGKVANYDSSYRIRRNTATIGLSMNHDINAADGIDVKGAYTFDRLNSPCYSADLDPMVSRNINRVDLDARFRHDGGWMKWYAGVGYSLFANGGRLFDYVPYSGYEYYAPYVDPDYRGAKENRFSILAGIKGDDGESASKWGADFTADIYHYSPHVRPSDYSVNASLTTSLISLTPSYTFKSRPFYLKVGVNLQGAFGMSSRFSIAPDVMAMWTPASQFALWVSADGGMKANDFARQMAVSQFAIPSCVYEYSRTAINSAVGFRVGPWSGFSLEGRAGYVMNKDWLAPGYGYFNLVKSEGGYFEARVNYNAPRFVTASVGFKRALPRKKGYDAGIWLWDGDYARQSFRAEAAVIPVKPLALRIAYELRQRQRGLYGTINNLSLGADYSITPMWSVFLSGENLLNRRYRLPGDVECRGITALAGFTCKF